MQTKRVIYPEDDKERVARRAIRIGALLQPQHPNYGQIRGAVLRVGYFGVDLVLNWKQF